jgi:hypothetical protein
VSNLINFRVGLSGLNPATTPQPRKVVPTPMRQSHQPTGDVFTLRFGENSPTGISPLYIANTRIEHFFDRPRTTIESLSAQSERIADKLRDNIQEAIDEFARQARESKTSGKPMEKIDGMTPAEITNHSAIQDMPYILDVVHPELGIAGLSGDRHQFYVRSNFLARVKDVALSGEEPGYRWFSFTPKGNKNPDGALIICVEDTSQTGGAIKIARGSEMEQIEGNPLLTQPGPETDAKDSKIFSQLVEIKKRFKEPR